jgi:uncharacterized protein (TIGR00730 family)
MLPNEPRELPPYEDLLDEYVKRLRNSDMSALRKRMCAMLLAESIDAMDSLTRADRTISIFGSARTSPDSPGYIKTVKIAELLGLAGYDIIQGDGPGIMQAAAEGAVKAGRRAFGLTIISNGTFEAKPNPFTTHHIPQHNMFTRKFAFLQADGFVIMGDYGIGTLDECTEVLTQLQLGLLKGRPVVCVGKEWARWRKLLEDLVEEGKMSPGDLELFSICDDPEDVVAIMLEHCPPTAGTAKA